MNVGSRSVAESMMCNIVARNITQPIHAIAHEIYTSHVKPLENKLDSLESDFGSYVYHTTDGQLSRPYDVAMLCAMHDDRVTKLVAEECENEREQYATDKAALVEALEECITAFEKNIAYAAVKDEHIMAGVLILSRAVLARVKGEV